MRSSFPGLIIVFAAATLGWTGAAAQADQVQLVADAVAHPVDLQMVARIRDHLQAQGTITLAEVPDLFGTSRKYAQAVLEEMDARRITRREGEGRVLR